MEQAEAFVDEVKERFSLWGRAFDDADEARLHTLFPFVLQPPVVLIERVWIETATEVTAVKRRFGLTTRDLNVFRKKQRQEGWPPFSAASITDILAEEKIEALALEFGGKFVGN